MEKSMVIPDLYALSVRQPWAYLITHGFKDIENRCWGTQRRGTFLIHAGKTMHRQDYQACILFVSRLMLETAIPFPPFEALKAQCGGIVGKVDIVDCVTASDSPWFVGEYGLVLSKQKVIPFTPCAGALGFFKPKL